MSMSLDIDVLEEPTLEFRYGQRLTDPKSGLSIFGAFDTDAYSWPGMIPYAVVGTLNGIVAFERFALALTHPTVSSMYADPNEEASSKLLWPPFPGFSAIYG